MSKMILKLWLLLFLFSVSAPLSALQEADESDSSRLEKELIGFSSSNIVLTAAGLSPGVLGTPAEIAQLANDIVLKNYPAVLYPPDDFDEFIGADECSFEMRSIDEAFGDFTETTSSMHFIKYDRLLNQFSDLGLPKVFHPDADVQVTVRNGHLNGDASALPEGRHEFKWSAETSMNWIMDVSLPGALIPTFVLAESALAKKLKAGEIAKFSKKGGAELTEQSIKSITKATKKKADLIIYFVGLASELGLISADVTNAAEAFEWYEKTSVITAINRGSQFVTVWDQHPPYFMDVASQAAVQTQDITLEATDFGGVRLGRVIEQLRVTFDPFDDCNRQLTTRLLEGPELLLKIDETTPLHWETSDAGPYHNGIELSENQVKTGEDIVTTLIQKVTVKDTQAPLLVPPAGFARESSAPIDLTQETFPLGMPLIVDLADPRPTFSHTAPDTLDVDKRYAIVWEAQDGSGNTTVAPETNPDQYTQFVTIKTPGTNSVPQAENKSAQTLTSQAVEIELTGVDTDMLDGRVDPLAFKIEDHPDNGQFEAPLLPFFIEDLRLSPVGDHEKIKDNEIVRTSPLKHLADQFRLEEPNNRWNFLKANICTAATGSLNREVFNNTVPVNFVYQPTYVYVDDKGFYYIRDNYWLCGNQVDHTLASPDIMLIPRISKWNTFGELVAMQELYPLKGKSYTTPAVGYNERPQNHFNFDATGRIWFMSSAIFTTFADVKKVASMNSDLEDLRDHGGASYNEQELIMGNRFIGVVSDPNRNLLYELHSSGVRVRPISDDYVIQKAPAMNFNREADCEHFRCVKGRDMVVDSKGYLYVLDNLYNRIHKFEPPFINDEGAWKVGEHMGWLGSCTANKANEQGVPYIACNEEAGTSHGYQCTDEKCFRASDDICDRPDFACERDATRGSVAGQFDNPGSIELSPQDILYVADTDNSRIQRFGTDGTFAGQAKSTGTGVNQGSEPGFVLGNMGQPKQLSVNSSAFYVMEPDADNGDHFVHVFKTIPFYDVTDASVKVKYVSHFDFQGDDTFTYSVDDGIAESELASVAVNISRAFRPPENLQVQCYNDFTTIEALTIEVPCVMDEDENIVVRASAQDKDGFISAGGLDTHTLSITVEPSHGTLVLLTATENAAVYRYTPNKDFNGNDNFAFSAFDGVHSSEQEGEASLKINPQPDPVVISLPENIKAARGFNRMINAEFDDVDVNHQPDLIYVDWGDSTQTRGDSWRNSGRYDDNGNEVSPQSDFSLGKGMLLGSHNYSNSRNHTLAIHMVNHDEDGGQMEPTIAVTNIEVIEATVVASTLLKPLVSVEPDTQFDIRFEVTNHKPENWAGLIARDIQVSIDIPEGLTLVRSDDMCTGTNPIVCELQDLAQGESTKINLVGRIDLASARENVSYILESTLIDAGPKAEDAHKSIAYIRISDKDGDATIDFDDAFPTDGRYAEDGDNDGIADEWELSFGLDSSDAADAAVDSDGDGRNNREEFLNDSYPLLAEAVHVSQPLTIDHDGDDRLGFRVAAGDVNGDGFSDVVAGAPGYEGQGAFVIYYGDEDGVNASPLYTVDATTALGRAVAVGDLNDDGYADIAVASNQDVFLFLGAAQALGEPIVIPTQLSGTTFGNALLISDIDNDSLHDLIISSPNDSVNDFIDNGAVYVYRASSEFWLQAESVRPDMTISIDDHDVRLGDSLAVGDVDGDSIPDLMVGAAFTQTGLVAGYLGRTIEWNTSEHLASDFILRGQSNGDRFGYSLASGVDIDGDGGSELLVGAYANNGTGAAYLYYSASMFWDPSVLSVVDTAYGELAGDQFGVAVLMTEPATFTGSNTVIVGSNRAERDILTSDEGRVDYFSPPNLVNKWFSDFGVSQDMLGYALANAGDVNGDGENDIVTGAPDISIGQHVGQGGYVRIYYGGNSPAQMDADGDFVADSLDNCPDQFNTDQKDVDKDNVGDVCDEVDNSKTESPGTNVTPAPSGNSNSGGGGYFAGVLPLMVIYTLVCLGLRRRGREKFLFH